MKILFSNEECVKEFYHALCDGLQLFGGYGLKLEYAQKSYELSRENLRSRLENEKLKNSICFEDVLRQMLLDGYSLLIIDVEGRGENNATIDLPTIYKNMKKLSKHVITDIISKNTDAQTAFDIIQTVAYSKEIFG